MDCTSQKSPAIFAAMSWMTVNVVSTSGFFASFDSGVGEVLFVQPARDAVAKVPKGYGLSACKDDAEKRYM